MLRIVSNAIKNTSANAMKTMTARHAAVLRGMRERSGKKRWVRFRRVKNIHSVMW
jgi:hypothetical protein